MLLTQRVSFLIVFALLVAFALSENARGADFDLPPDDPEARGMFERFASMYAGLERYHEQATMKTEISSVIDSFGKGMSEYELWEVEFEAPNLIRVQHGNRFVSDGNRIVVADSQQGFYVERVAPGRDGMLSALADLSGEQPVLPPSVYWLFAARQGGVFEYFNACSFTDTGAEKLDGVACVWVDATWVHRVGLGGPETLTNGRWWFAAETGRLHRFEYDMTELMNKKFETNLLPGTLEMLGLPPGHQGPLIDRAVAIVDIVMSDIPEQFDATTFITLDPTGLRRADSLVKGFEETQKETKRVAETEIHEQAEPLLTLDDVRPDRITLERVSANTGFVLMSDDFNDDGVDDILFRTNRHEFFLLDGRTNTNTEIKLEGISRADQPHISHLMRTPTGSGLLVLTTTNDAGGDSVSTIGVFDLDGRKRWSRAYGSGEAGFIVGLFNSVAGDLNGDGFDEVAVLVFKIENDRPHHREIRLVVMDADGVVIVSKELDEQMQIRFVGADRPGKRGWITCTSSSGVYRLVLD